MTGFRVHVSVPGVNGFDIHLTGPEDYEADTWARTADDVQEAARQQIAADLGLAAGTFGITINITITGGSHGDVELHRQDQEGP